MASSEWVGQALDIPDFPTDICMAFRYVLLWCIHALHEVHDAALNQMTYVSTYETEMMISFLFMLL